MSFEKSEKGLVTSLSSLYPINHLNELFLEISILLTSM